MPGRFVHALVAVLFALALALPPGASPGGVAAGDDAESPVSRVDLARVPLSPSDLPERGFQLAQAGDLTLSSLHFALSGDSFDEREWEAFDADWRSAYSQILVLLSDRADASSPPLASYTTFLVEMASDEAARDAARHFFALSGAEPDETGAGVLTFDSPRNVIAAIVEDTNLVWVQYTAEVVDGAGQSTGDWGVDALVDLAKATVDRLGAAGDGADGGEPALGIGNAMVFGPDALWSIPWHFFPNTEHYRVLDGEVLPYGGDLRADLRNADPDGVVDLFVSRQQVGDDGYDHLIDVSLARFESERDAEAFAADPLPILFPPGFEFEATYNQPQREGDVLIERASVNDAGLRASGWRSIRQVGEVVQVVQWLGSGTSVVSREAFAAFTSYQSGCLDALPDPCSPIDQVDLGVAVDAESAGDFPTGDPATPVSGGNGAVIASPQFGWSVLLPDDGWSIVDVQIIGTSEYYQLQSGRSLITIETAVDQVGEPQQCVLDNMHLLQELEDRAVIDLGSDDPDERPAGLEQGHGWAIYTVEPLQEERADQEYTIRIDCYTLVEGQASLVVTHTAPRDLWTEERDKGERLRDAIVLP